MTKEELYALIEAKNREKKLNSKRIFSMNITRDQGLYIQYRLRCAGFTCADIARELSCSSAIVSQVTKGQRHSKRIEKAVADALGYDSWNALVSALRENAA